MQEDAYGNDGPDFLHTPNAIFLFCLAAYADEDTSLTDNWKDHVTCDAVKTKKVAFIHQYLFPISRKYTSLGINPLGKD